MAPATSRALFVETLRRVASKHDFKFTALSKDWVIQITDPSSGAKCSIFGYTFDVNPAAAAEICKEKAATSLVLSEHGVPNIGHHVFLSPSNEFTVNYMPRAGNWSEIQKLVAEIGFPVVVKPLKGTGGLDVFKAKCWRDLEGAVQQIFSREYGLAVSPYKNIREEYRCVVLDDTVELIYKKLRSTVVGDGIKCVGALIGESLARTNPKDMPGLAKAASNLSPAELNHVPERGVEVPVQWKHNLGQGATASMDVPEAAVQGLREMAPKAARAIGVRFCSVDIVDVENEGLVVMEVNGGVMMDSLMSQLGLDGSDLALRLYETAVLKAMSKL